MASSSALITLSRLSELTNLLVFYPRPDVQPVTPPLLEAPEIPRLDLDQREIRAGTDALHPYRLSRGFFERWARPSYWYVTGFGLIIS